MHRLPPHGAGPRGGHGTAADTIPAPRQTDSRGGAQDDDPAAADPAALDAADDPAGEGERRALRMYGQPSKCAALAWSWVDRQLRVAGAYGVVAAGDRPHPRPVWGVWHGQRLHLSIGSPVLNHGLSTDSRLVVHLDSGTDVVIVEGRDRRGS